jgi:hypothetical protein
LLIESSGSVVVVVAICISLTPFPVVGLKGKDR